MHWGTAPMSAVSEHAWGTAVDFSTGINPMLATRPADAWAHTDMPHAAVRIAADLGLTWGGNWSVPFDPQHWEIAGTPRDVAATAAAIRVQYAPKPMERAGQTMLVRAQAGMVLVVGDQRYGLNATQAAELVKQGLPVVDLSTPALYELGTRVLEGTPPV